MDTFLDYDKSSKGVVFSADRAYEPGEQVKIMNPLLRFGAFGFHSCIDCRYKY